MENNNLKQSTKDLVNEKASKLNKENNIYFNNIYTYITTASFTKDENKLDKVMLDIVNDLLEAQNNGKSAKEYFGSNPKEYADQILKEIPSNSNKFITTLVVMLPLLIVFGFIFKNLYNGKMSFIIPVLLIVLQTFIAFFFVNKIIYSKRKAIWYLLIIVLFISLNVGIAFIFR